MRFQPVLHLGFAFQIAGWDVTFTGHAGESLSLRWLRPLTRFHGVHLLPCSNQIPQAAERLLTAKVLPLQKAQCPNRRYTAEMLAAQSANGMYASITALQCRSCRGISQEVAESEEVAQPAGTSEHTLHMEVRRQSLSDLPAHSSDAHCMLRCR